MQMTARSITTFLCGAALLLASSGIAGAQERAPEDSKQQNEAQAKLGVGGVQSRGGQNTGATRRLGPGDGNGHQGIQPQNGTGNGSPGKIGAGDGNATRKGAGNGTATRNGKANKSGESTRNAKGTSGLGGSGKGTLTRSRTRNLSGSGSGTCTGRGSGPQRRGGTRGSKGGGRR